MTPPYLSAAAPRIAAKKSQQAFPWAQNYSTFSNDPLVAAVFRLFPSHTIDRPGLVNAWKSQPRDVACVATLMWGGIDIPKGHFKLFLDQGIQRINRSLDAICSALDDDLICTAFLRAQGSAKLAGVSYPFFTKILFFYSLSLSKRPSLLPLIFDKWTKTAFYALLLEVDPQLASELFRPIDLSKIKIAGAAVRSGSKLVAAYMAYLEHMRHWASSIGVTEEQLEEFLFGSALNSDRSPSNPRRELLSVIELALPLR